MFPLQSPKEFISLTLPSLRPFILNTYRIPAFGGLEAVLVAAGLRALVFALRDVREDRRIGCVSLVDERHCKTKGRFVVVEAVGVEEGDDTCEDRRGAGSPGEL